LERSDIPLICIRRAVVISILPALQAYLILQNKIVSGMTAGAIKG